MPILVVPWEGQEDGENKDLIATRAHVNTLAANVGHDFPYGSCKYNIFLFWPRTFRKQLHQESVNLFRNRERGLARLVGKRGY